MLIIIFIVGVITVDMSKNEYVCLSDMPIILAEETADCYNFAVFGQGVSIEKSYVNYITRAIEEKGYLIPAPIRLILQGLNVILS